MNSVKSAGGDFFAALTGQDRDDTDRFLLIAIGCLTGFTSSGGERALVVLRSGLDAEGAKYDSKPPLLPDPLHVDADRLICPHRPAVSGGECVTMLLGHDGNQCVIR